MSRDEDDNDDVGFEVISGTTFRRNDVPKERLNDASTHYYGGYNITSKKPFCSFTTFYGKCNEGLT